METEKYEYVVNLIMYKAAKKEAWLWSCLSGKTENCGNCYSLGLGHT